MRVLQSGTSVRQDPTRMAKHQGGNDSQGGDQAGGLPLSISPREDVKGKGMSTQMLD